MQIDPTTGKVAFVAIEKLDKATGKVTATFDSLGPVMLIEKVPVVTKKVSPEKYADEKVADAAKKLKDQKAGFTLTDFIDDQRTDHQPGRLCQRKQSYRYGNQDVR